MVDRLGDYARGMARVECMNCSDSLGLGGHIAGHTT